MKKIGLTGGIGSGKSFIGKILESMGYPVYYSDQRARTIMNTNSIIRAGLTKIFGSEAFINDRIDRDFLAHQIFNKPVLRTKINDLVHPIVRDDFNKWSKSHNAHQFIFNEAAILFETGANKNFDAVILVCAPEHLKIERVLERDAIKEDDIRLKMNTQWEDDQKMKLTPYHIVNDGIQSIPPQIENILLAIDS